MAKTWGLDTKTGLERLKLRDIFTVLNFELNNTRDKKRIF